MPTARPTPSSASPPIRLTRRELEVASWLGEDLSLPQIAQKLAVTEHAIRKHLQNIEFKLGVRTRPAAVAQLILHGFVVLQSGLDGHAKMPSSRKQN